MNSEIMKHVQETQHFLDKKELDRQTVIDSMSDRILDWVGQLGISEGQIEFASTEDVGKEGHLDPEEGLIQFQLAIGGQELQVETRCSLFWNPAKNEWCWKEWFCPPGGSHEWMETSRLTLSLVGSEKVCSPKKLAEQITKYGVNLLAAEVQQ